MRLATNYERIHNGGAEVLAISVNDDVRQTGMAQRWGLTHTMMVSDPGGEKYLQGLELFDPGDRDGIALPGMVLVTPDGEILYRYQGRDFADRTNDDDIWAALEATSLPAVSPAPWEPTAEVPDDLHGYFRPVNFREHFRGNMFGAIAIGGRLEDKAARAIAREHRVMSQASVEAWDLWKSANDL